MPCVGVFIVYLRAKFRIPTYNNPLITGIKPKAKKETLRTPAMLVDISKTHYLNKSCKFFQALLQCYASGP
jgi:hypothetical protein